MKIYQPTKPLPTRRNEAWAVNVAKLDIPNRPTIVMVVDVGTRGLLSATVTLAAGQDVAHTLERLVRRSGTPREIWVDRGLRPLHVLTERYGFEVVSGAGSRIDAVTAPALLRLRAHLHDRRFASLVELGHEIERWRKSRRSAAAPQTVRGNGPID